MHALKPTTISNIPPCQIIHGIIIGTSATWHGTPDGQVTIPYFIGGVRAEFHVGMECGFLVWAWALHIYIT